MDITNWVYKNVHVSDIENVNDVITILENFTRDYQAFQLHKTQVSGSLQSEIYLTYDRCDGEVFCAFDDKEQCEREAKESGCGMQTVILVSNQ